MKLSSFLLIGLILQGCAAKRHLGIDYVVGLQCHPTAKLLHCDSSEPPNCKQIALKFDKGCEQVIAHE